jgi:hypothetical protein
LLVRVRVLRTRFSNDCSLLNRFPRMCFVRVRVLELIHHGYAFKFNRKAELGLILAYMIFQYHMYRNDPCCSSFLHGRKSFSIEHNLIGARRPSGKQMVFVSSQSPKPLLISGHITRNISVQAVHFAVFSHTAAHEKVQVQVQAYVRSASSDLISIMSASRKTASG